MVVAKKSKNTWWISWRTKEDINHFTKKKNCRAHHFDSPSPHIYPLSLGAICVVTSAYLIDRTNVFHFAVQ